MNDLATPIAVVAHDAGAANLLLAWLEAWGGSVRPFMQGPASVLWSRTFPDIPICASLDEALDGAASLISGTGWSSDLEHQSRILAHRNGIRSVAVVDHWVNYTERFERTGTIQLPDEIWVADSDAKRIALETFPSTSIRQFKNLYQDSQVRKIFRPPEHGVVLYLLEPTRQTWGRNTAGEFQALEYFLVIMDKLWVDGVKQVLLRPHPSENLEKYERYVRDNSRISIDQSVNLAAAISRADIVVGVESAALTVALAAGRPVFSSLPPWAPALRLPQSGIKQIRDILI